MTDTDAAAERFASEIQAHEARNAALLSRLRELGARLDVPRSIDCHFWAPTATSAELLRSRLLAKRLTDVVANTSPDDPTKWNVEGTLETRPDIMGSRGMTSQLVELAASCGAEYDGWGTAVHEVGPKESSGSGSPTSGCS